MQNRSNKWVRQVQTPAGPTGHQTQAIRQSSTRLEASGPGSGANSTQQAAEASRATAPTVSPAAAARGKAQQQQHLTGHARAGAAGLAEEAGAAAHSNCWQWVRQQATSVTAGTAMVAKFATAHVASQYLNPVAPAPTAGLLTVQHAKQPRVKQYRREQPSAYQWHLQPGLPQPATGTTRQVQPVLSRQQQQPVVAAVHPASSAHTQFGSVSVARADQASTTCYKRHRGNQLIRVRSNEMHGIAPPACTESGHAVKRLKLHHSSSACQHMQPASQAASTGVRKAGGLMDNRCTHRTQHKWVRTQASTASTPPPALRGSKLFKWVRTVAGSALTKAPSTPGSISQRMALKSGIHKCSSRLAAASHAQPGNHRRQQQQQQQQQHKQLVRLGALVYHVVRGPHGQRQLRAVPATSHATASTPSSITRAALVKARLSPKVDRTPHAVTPGSSLPKLRFGRSWRTSLAASRISKTLSQARNQARTRTARKVPPCSTFCRTGACSEYASGRCRLEHDPGKVAVCIHWLQGSCNKPGCKMQHKVCKDLMPVCTFFLQGTCSTEDCPYLHVNYPAGTPVCRAFTRGFCPMGHRCSKQHVRVKRTATAGSKGANKQVRVGRG